MPTKKKRAALPHDLVIAAPKRPDEQKPATVATTLLISVKTMERARAAVYNTRGLTLTALVSKAVDREIDRMESERGKPFPLPELLT
jgi:hypothetical protein